MTSLGRLDRSRILVKATNWLGDVVMGMPALRALRSAAPAAHLTVMIRAELASLLDGARWIDEVLAYPHPHGRDRMWRLPGIVRSMRAGHFDWAILLPSRPEPAVWALLAGIPRRVGYALYGRGPLLTHKAALAPSVAAGHQTHWYLDLLRQTLAIESADAVPAIDVDAAALERMSRWLASRRALPGVPLVALAPGAAFGAAKEWGRERYAALCERLTARGFECVLVGGPTERSRCEAIARESAAGAIVAAGETSAGELAALLSLCQGFVGNDSGATHLAAALGVPTLGVFGSTAPERTGPVGPRAQALYDPIDCSPCLARVCRFGHQDCFRAITPERVVDALLASGCGA